MADSFTESQAAYDRLSALLRRFTSFNLSHAVGVRCGGVIVHIATQGLPLSRHSDPVAAELKTRSAQSRLQAYERLIEQLCVEMRLPVYLFELSREQVRSFLEYAPRLDSADRLKIALRSCLIPHYEEIRALADWNPVLRVDRQGGMEVGSLWDTPLISNPSDRLVAHRLAPLLGALSAEKRWNPLPVRMIFTEGDIDLMSAIRARNLPYYQARETGGLVEYYKITEPS